MNTQARLIDKTKRIKALEQELKERDNKIKSQADTIGALQNELDVVNAELNKWRLKQAQGYSWVTLKPNTNEITQGGIVLPYATFIYTQDIPSDIAKGYYKLIDGKVELDKQKYMKSRGGL